MKKCRHHAIFYSWPDLQYEYLEYDTGLNNSTWESWRPKSPATRLFVQNQIQVNNKHPNFALMTLHENMPVYSTYKGRVMQKPFP